jgi:hypothetical protein
MAVLVISVVYLGLIFGSKVILVREVKLIGQAILNKKASN